MAFILLLLASGAARAHRAFHSRFERIVQERNHAVEELRRGTP